MPFAPAAETLPVSVCWPASTTNVTKPVGATEFGVAGVGFGITVAVTGTRMPNTGVVGDARPTEVGSLPHRLNERRCRGRRE